MAQKAVGKEFIVLLLIAALAITLGTYALLQSPQFRRAQENPPSKTLSPFPSGSSLQTLSPTSTLSPSPAPSLPQPTETVTSSLSPSPTLTPTPLQTPSPTVIPTPTTVATPTPTPLPTSTPTPTPTPIPTTTPTPTPVLPPPPNNTIVISQATNWAGYVVASKLQSPEPIFNGVSGSWVVPAVGASIDDTFSSAWIGIGGQYDQSLIQCGTAHHSVGNQILYSAWFELLPFNAITIQGMIISAGDVIEAHIQLLNATAGQWLINITDVTSGQSFVRGNIVYSSSRLSAEWIIERPTVNNVFGTLGDFGSVTFTNCKVTTAQGMFGISSFPANQIAMYSSTSPFGAGVLLATVSALNAEGTGFTVTYLSSG